MNFAVRQLACSSTHSGLLAQSGSLQSTRVSLSSSKPLLQISGCGAQLGSKEQAGSAQSIWLLQLLSSPSLQTSLVHCWQSGEAMHCGSAQSTSESQSLSKASLHCSGEPGGTHSQKKVPSQSG